MKSIIKRPKSFDEAEIMEEFEEEGHVWIKISENARALVMDDNCEPLTVETPEVH